MWPRDEPGKHQLSEPIQRLTEVPSATWAEVAGACRGVFSDVDDTLTERGHLVPSACAALHALRDAGLRTVLVTGRPLGWAEVLATLLPVDAAIAENGAVAALPGGSRLYYDDEAARSLGAERRAAARAHVAHELPWVRPAMDQSLRDVDLAFDIDEHEHLSAEDILRTRTLLESHGLRTTRSSIHLHGTFSLADKAKMSARVAQHLWGEPAGLVASRYLYVGDSPNDAPAFSFFRHSVGVANVERHLPALRALGVSVWAVTAQPGGRGFAELITHLLQVRPVSCPTGQL